MKKLLMVFLLLFGFLVSVVHGKVLDELFSEEFFRYTSSPYEEIKHFNGIIGEATITITNGGLENSDGERVSSSVISLNGNIIVDASNFNQKVEKLQRVAHLNSGDNELKIILRGKPGGSLYILITQEAETIETFPSTEDGNVSVTEPESPIYGTKVEVPKESIPDGIDSVEIKITATQLPLPLSDEFHPTGTSVNIESNVSEFKDTTPLKLSIPYNDKNNDGIVDGTALPESKIGVKYFNENLFIWEDIKVVERNSDLNIVTIETNHFSNYVTFAEKYNPSPNTTPVISSGVISVDGDPTDWYLAGISPYGTDPEGDLNYGTGFLDFDIKNVYTAIGEDQGITYAYLMIETYGGNYPPNAMLDISVNYRPGQSLWHPFADLGFTVHDQPTTYSNCMAHNLGDKCVYIYNYDFGTWFNFGEYAKGQVFEFRVPVSVFTNYDGYFNVISAHLYKDENWEQYDQFWFGSYIASRIEYRRHENQSPEYCLATTLMVEDKPITEDVITSMTLMGPLNDPNYQVRNFTIPEPGKTFFHLYSYIYGRWDNSIADLRYDSAWTEAGDVIATIIDEIPAGNYRIIVSDNLGATYEGEKYFSGGNEDIAILPINSLMKYFDENGDLHCYWESPNLLKLNQHQERRNSRVHVVSKLGDKYNSYIFGQVPINYGKVIIPSDLLSSLNSGADHLEIGILSRDGDNSNRAYSARDILTIGQPVLPEDWKAPYSSDWVTNGIDTLKWYPEYYNSPTYVTVGNDNILLGTYDTGQGEATYSTKYHLSGDLDVQVDFNVLEWQSGGCGQLDFQLGYGGPNQRVLIGLFKFPDSDQRYYQTTLFDGNGWYGFPQVSTDDNSGKFKIIRTGTIIRTFYSDPDSAEADPNGWVLLGEWDSGGGQVNDIGAQPVRMILNNYIYCDSPTRIRANFFNFKINSD